MKSIKKKIDQILYLSKNQVGKSKLRSKIIINELILLNIRMEKILYDQMNKLGNPVNLINKDLTHTINVFKELDFYSKFEKNQKVKKINFVREKEHQKLFQKLWKHYTFSEFKKDRLSRYVKRIKINNLQKLIKDKKIIDFGCGHGNFLMSCYAFDSKFCLGIDYGGGSINYANEIRNKLKIDKSKVNFIKKNIYSSGQKNESFDFAIQNGVFHHLDDEIKAYKEVYRVLKKDGYFWLYTDGGGGIRDMITNMSQKILSKIDKDYVIDQIRSIGLNSDKEYFLGDNLNALYRQTNMQNLKTMLKKIGFKEFKQMNGGYSTDYDKPFSKDKFFNQKFGSGDLRVLCKK